jgi:hypothetical protein
MDCGHEPHDKQRCCTLDASEVCPCCRATQCPHCRNGKIRMTIGHTSWDMDCIQCGGSGKRPNDQAER